VKGLWVVLVVIFAAASLQAADDWTDQPPDSGRVERQGRFHRSGRVRPRHHDDAHISIGHNYTLAADEISEGPVVVIGGSATIDGRVDDDVVVVGGTVHVGPTASIQGDVVSIGGHAEIDPMARVSGDVTNLALAWPDIKWPWASWNVGWASSFTRVFSAIRLSTTVLLAMLLALIFPSTVGRVAQRVAHAPLQSLFVGFAAQILAVPLLAGVTILLVISIIGIPLLLSVPVIVALAIGLCIVGFAGVAAFVGRLLRTGGSEHESSALDVLIGFAALAGCTIVGETMANGPEWNSGIAFTVRGLGMFIEYLAWTVGTGAGIAAILSRRRMTIPPPIPAAYRSPSRY